MKPSAVRSEHVWWWWWWWRRWTQTDGCLTLRCFHGISASLSHQQPPNTFCGPFQIFQFKWPNYQRKGIFYEFRWVFFVFCYNVSSVFEVLELLHLMMLQVERLWIKNKPSVNSLMEMMGHLQPLIDHLDQTCPKIKHDWRLWVKSTFCVICNYVIINCIKINKSNIFVSWHGGPGSASLIQMLHSNTPYTAERHVCVSVPFWTTCDCVCVCSYNDILFTRLIIAVAAGLVLCCWSILSRLIRADDSNRC